MNYNTTPQLWANLREALLSAPEEKQTLKVIDGSIYQEGEGYVGRFSNSEDATKVLVETGWIKGTVQTSDDHPDVIPFTPEPV